MLEFYFSSQTDVYAVYGTFLESDKIHKLSIIHVINAEWVAHELDHTVYIFNCMN